jgi:deoxyribodipyrimidine photolyase-related protein
MKSAVLIFPHQLFEEPPFSWENKTVFLLEEALFFSQFPFHKQKLAFHRASMKFYEDFLIKNGFDVHYVESSDELSDISKLVPYLKSKGHDRIDYVDVTDDWLKRRLIRSARDSGIMLNELGSPMFLNSKRDITDYFTDKKSYRQTDFYTWQRKKWNILMEPGNRPLGGKWTYDTDNRKKYPPDKKPPFFKFYRENKYYREAKSYVQANFPDHYGHLDENIHYPVTFDEARAWLDRFLEERFHDYGEYQDAIVNGEAFLHHSILSPMLNIGLLTPVEVIDRAVDHAKMHDTPLNSLEGFIRQILGWREFIRGVYEISGKKERTLNFWGFTRKIPESFWNGTTGIDPVDSVIKSMLVTGYNHHIERLMVLGNFMLLCEFDPDEVYRWFMTMYIDAYDWVMVPNVYGMSQFADGGLISTKPYISGSNYLMKMSDFPKGDWQQVWDALFWRFMHVHRDFFLSNPRLGMLVRSFDSMESTKRNKLLKVAADYLDSL